MGGCLLLLALSCPAIAEWPYPHIPGGCRHKVRLPAGVEWDSRTHILLTEHQSHSLLPEDQKGLELLEYLPPQNWHWTIPPTSSQEVEGSHSGQRFIGTLFPKSAQMPTGRHWLLPAGLDSTVAIPKGSRREPHRGREASWGRRKAWQPGSLQAWAGREGWFSWLWTVRPGQFRPLLWEPHS